MRDKEKGQDLLDRCSSASTAQAPRTGARSHHRRDPAAADPGHRQCRRLHDDGRGQGRQLRLRQAAERRPTRSSPTPDRSRRCRRSFTSFRASTPQLYLDDQPHQGRDARRHRRPGLHGARELSRLDLRHPVQQVRPGVPGLCAGRRPVPHAAGATSSTCKVLHLEGRDGAARGRWSTSRRVEGPSLISLYNLYPSATISGLPSTDFSSGQVMSLLNQVADKTLPPGMGTEWTAMSYQEAIVGNQIYFVFGLAVLLVYFCLAGQYESWILPLSVILAVPLALLGTVAALTGIGIANNLYTQIGLILLIALGSKNAILIVEYAREKRDRGDGHRRGRVEAARAPLPADHHDVLRLHPRRGAAGRRHRRRRQCARARSASPCSAACSPRPASRFSSSRHSTWSCSGSRNGGSRGRSRRGPSGGHHRPVPTSRRSLAVRERGTRTKRRELEGDSRPAVWSRKSDEFANMLAGCAWPGGLF